MAHGRGVQLLVGAARSSRSGSRSTRLRGRRSREAQGRPGGRTLGLALGLMALTGALPVIIIALLTSGGSDPPPPDAAKVRAAQRRRLSAVLGRGEVDGLPLTSLRAPGTRLQRRVRHVQGVEDAAARCRSRFRRTRSASATRSSTAYARRRAARVRGVIGARRRGHDRASDRCLQRHRVGAARAHERVLAALRPRHGRARPPACRRPATRSSTSHELRRVRDAYVRTGSIRAVRNRLGISQRAVRFRLRLAEELGSARLRRPPRDFAGEPCAVEPPS